MTEEIQSFGDWKDNAELFAEVAELEYLPEPVLDMTYGEGVFWRLYRPAQLFTNDLDPCNEDVEYHEDCRAMTFTSGWIKTVVFDPPYKLSGRNRLPKFDAQYGLVPNKVTPIQEILGVLVGGIAEAARIATDFVLVKCMDQISSGQLVKQTAIAYDVARAMGLKQVGEFWIEGDGIPQDEERGQQHERHTRSTLMIFGQPGANNRRKKRLTQRRKETDGIQD